LLRDYPRQAEAHFLLARALLDDKKRQMAMPYAEAAHKLAPDNSHYAYYLGYLYMDYRLHEFALPLFRQAIKTSPEVSQFQEAIGACYQDIGRGEEAIRHLREALRAPPDERARTRILGKLTQALVTADKADEARLYIAELLKGDIRCRVMGARDAAMITPEGVQSEEGHRIKALLETEALSDSHRVQLLLALGRLFERDKDYATAFDHWAKARDISKSQNWFLRDHTARIAESVEFYQPDLVDRLSAFGSTSDVPVFVVGMPRSGTTLTEQIIAAHPQADGVGELARFEQLDRAFRSDYPAGNRLDNMLRNARAGEFVARADETLRIFRVVADSQAARIVEKTPHNFQNLGYLRLMFPKARFVHIRRHPLDAFISSYQNNLNASHGYAYDQEEYLKEYLYHERFMDYWKSLFPGNILTVHYEQLTSEPESWARKILEFVGLPWHDDCLRFFEKAGTVRTFSTQQVRKPVNTQSIARWRRYAEQLGPISKALAESGFNYPGT